jgi:hypothetical protein
LTEATKIKTSIIKTWRCISPNTSAKGFKKCCISNAVDVSDDDMLWNDSEEVGNVRSECKDDEGTGCDSGHHDTDW